MISGYKEQLKTEQMSYQDLQAELRSTIAAVRNMPINTVPYILLKRKANELHLKLIEVERSQAVFNKRCLFGNYTNELKEGK